MFRLTKYFLTTVCLSAVLLSSCKPNKPPEVNLAQYLLRNRLTTSNDSALIYGVADTLLARTPYAKRFAINQSYVPGKINIYLINGDMPALCADQSANQLIENCRYAGNGIIFYDVAYVHHFLSKHQIPSNPFNIYLKDDQICLNYWILGHELGHFICGHVSGAFDSTKLDQMIRTSSIDNKQELQADSVFVTAMLSDKKLLASEERLMINILNAEIFKKVGPVQAMGVGIIYDYSSNAIVNYARKKVHPEYIIRASRILELSARMGNDSGTYNLVKSFVKHLKEAE